MSHVRPNKERVNISVNPQVHGRFSLLAERNSQSVSGILNDLMMLYCGPRELDDDLLAVSPQVIQRLRQTLLVSEQKVLRQVVRRIANEAGLQDIDLDASDPAGVVKIPAEYVSEWIGQVAKLRTGVRLTFNLANEPDIALGQSLMFRGESKCDRVILVVPCRLGVSQRILQATEQAGLEVCGVDALESYLRQRPATEGQRRLSDAAKELDRIKTRRKKSSANAARQPA